ncbi:MAG: hypothetical protein OXM02_04705 [Bacteroidota bacterium]|nr:hypothetical protein [Bacteroidota bacterium]MDE2833803.1 hypothetical protein [Bacteroidota bacterium]
MHRTGGTEGIALPHTPVAGMVAGRVRVIPCACCRVGLQRSRAARWLTPDYEVRARRSGQDLSYTAGLTLQHCSTLYFTNAAAWRLARTGWGSLSAIYLQTRCPRLYETATAKRVVLPGSPAALQASAGETWL